MLHRALKMAFWVTYDHLGKAVFLNAVCMIPVALVCGLAFELSTVYALLLLGVTFACVVPAFLAALGHVARALVEEHEAPLLAFVEGLRRHALQGAIVGAVFSVAIALSLGGAWYYLAILERPTPLFAYLLAAVCLWCAAFFGAAYTLALPAIPQKRAGAFAAVRTGVLLTVDNPVYCAVILLHILAFAIFAFVPPVFVLFSLSPIAVLQATAYEILARKYAAPLIDGKRVPTFNDESDDYLNRGLRDFLFPWKM